MFKAEITREVKENIFYSKLYLHGYTLEKLGKALDPPVSKYRVWQIVNKCTPDYRLHEIADLLKTNIQTIFPRSQKTAERI